MKPCLTQERTYLLALFLPKREPLFNEKLMRVPLINDISLQTGSQVHEFGISPEAIYDNEESESNAADENALCNYYVVFEATNSSARKGEKTVQLERILTFLVETQKIRRNAEVAITDIVRIAGLVVPKFDINDISKFIYNDKDALVNVYELWKTGRFYVFMADQEILFDIISELSISSSRKSFFELAIYLKRAKLDLLSKEIIIHEDKLDLLSKEIRIAKDLGDEESLNSLKEIYKTLIQENSTLLKTNANLYSLDENDSIGDIGED